MGRRAFVAGLGGLLAGLAVSPRAQADDAGAEPRRPQFFPGPTELSFTSARDGAPVAGAAVFIKGVEYRSDASGRVVVPDLLFAWAEMTVRAPGFLERRTLLRWDRAFTLWPLSPELGRRYVQYLVYGGTGVLVRLRSKEVNVVPGAEVAADDRALDALRDAARYVSQATGATLSVVPEAAPGAARVDVVVDPLDKRLLRSQAIAGFYRQTRGYFIEGGRLVVSTPALARCRRTLAHELGHLCFWHSASGDDLMALQPTGRRKRRFSARERAVLALAEHRLPGSRFPDDDHHLGPYAAQVALGQMRHDAPPAAPGLFARLARLRAPAAESVFCCA